VASIVQEVLVFQLSFPWHGLGHIALPVGLMMARGALAAAESSSKEKIIPAETISGRRSFDRTFCPSKRRAAVPSWYVIEQDGPGLVGIKANETLGRILGPGNTVDARAHPSAGCPTLFRDPLRAGRSPSLVLTDTCPYDESDSRVDPMHRM
jgi:hypothetical protein